MSKNDILLFFRKNADFFQISELPTWYGFQCCDNFLITPIIFVGH
jgi:hypothetical protein